MTMWEMTKEGLGPAGCCVVTKPLCLEDKVSTQNGFHRRLGEILGKVGGAEPENGVQEIQDHFESV